MSTLGYLASPKYSDAGIVTGSSTIGNGFVTNVQNPEPRSRALFTTGNPYIEGDLGFSMSMNTISLAFINSRSALDTVRFRCRNNLPVTTSPLIDETFTLWPPGSDLSAYMEMHRTHELLSTVSARYWRVDFSCIINVEVARVFPSLRIEPEHNVSAWSTDAQEPIAATVSLGGAETRRPMGRARRSARMEWPALSKIEALGRVYELTLERGSSRDYLATLNYGADEIISPMAYIYMGYGALKVVRNTMTHLFSATLDMSELAAVRML